MPSTAGRVAAISCAIIRGAFFSRFANSNATGDAASPSSIFGGRSSTMFGTTPPSASPYFARICAASASRNRLVSVIYTVVSCLAESNSEYKCHSQERSKKESHAMTKLSRFLSALIFAFLPSPLLCATEKSTTLQLTELAKSPGPVLRDAINATFDAKDLQEGTAWSGRGPDFFFTTRAAAKPQLFIDSTPGPEMHALPSTDFWFAVAKIEAVGKLHSFHYLLNGAKFGGKLDVPAFTPLSYLQSGVPSGTLSEKITHVSKIYEGMKSDCWIYVPAQYKQNT